MDDQLTVILGERRYAVHRHWGHLPPGETFGFVSDLVVDDAGRVHVAQRDRPLPMLVFDRDGRHVGEWGCGVIADPHYVTRTDAGTIWVADRDAHQVLEFDSAGRPIRALGRRHWPSHGAPFNHPTCAVAGPHGDLFVTDGYGNSLIHRFSEDGQLLRSWGGPGGGAGAFTTPHGLCVDDENRVYVTDRENNRVQVFDCEGNLLSVWGDFYHPMAIWRDERGLFVVTDQIPRISLLNADGVLLGRCRGSINGAHGISGDAEGNLFLAELPPQDVTKLERLN